MKEDILEQIAEDYCQHNGYFTMHNIRYRPEEDSSYDKRKDSNYSDIDIIGMNPLKQGVDRVWVFDCKSWQDGFSMTDWLKAIRNSKHRAGRDSWKCFRALCNDKWSKTFSMKIKELTGETQFTYYTAVTCYREKDPDKASWENEEIFKRALGHNPIKLIALREMLQQIYDETKKSLAPSEVGRLLQLIKASGWQPQHS